MGKQSRRKKGVDKKAKKQRQQQQRQQQRPERNDDEPDELEEGSRVIYPKHGGTDQGIVCNLYETICTVLPLAASGAIEDLASNVESVRTDSLVVVKDTVPWTLRFDVGDKVIHRNSDGKWMSGVIDQTWPVLEDGRRNQCIPLYKISRVSGLLKAYSGNDTDRCLMKRPTAFQFEEGDDDVLFSTSKAMGLTTNRRRRPWIQGRISGVDIDDRREYYAVYEVNFVENNKRRTCYVLKDDEEHITRLNSSPRARLMNAIEQDCSYEFFNSLVESSGLDVIPFRDLLVGKAIESGSYDALLWLRNHATVDLYRIRDDDGNGLLHQIAWSPHAERFILAAAGRAGRPSHEHISLSDYRCDFFAQTNKKGRNWLHELILSGNVRALELALSPINGLAWELFTWLRFQSTEEGHISPYLYDVIEPDENGLDLKGAVRLRNDDYIMEKILEKFERLYYTHGSFAQLDAECSDIALGQHVCSDKYSLTPGAARAMIRFHRDLVKGLRKSMSIETLVSNMSGLGYLQPLSTLINEDPLLLLASQGRPLVTSANRNEFAQPDSPAPTKPEQRSDLDLVSRAALGFTSFYSEGLADEKVRSEYSTVLVQYIEELNDTGKTYKEEPLDVYLAGEIASLVYEEDDCDDEHYPFVITMKYKLELLLDDSLLEKRLEVLDYLVKEKAQSPPNVLDVIQWRQCGVLRWLVEGSFVDLENLARGLSDISGKAKHLLFLEGRKMPQSMSVGTFLCFAAIEFDDLQSLRWLVEDRGISLSEIHCYGWNMLHCCAFFGRTEIVLWAKSHHSFRHLVEEACSRKPQSGLYSAHIAVQQGFALLAEFLIKSGCPIHDEAKKTIFFHAKNSKLESVREFGTLGELPELLERDIKVLLQLLSLEIVSVCTVKEHLSKTDCMDTKRWAECNYLVYEPGPLGMTYLDILDECCKIDEPEFMLWFCRRLAVNEYWGEAQSPRRTRKNELDRPALKKFATEQNDDFLCQCLGLQWTKNLTCLNPAETRPVLRAVMRRFHPDSPVSTALRMFHDDCLRLDVVNQVGYAALQNLEILLAQGAGSEDVQSTIDIVTMAANELNDRKYEDEQFWRVGSILLPDGEVCLQGILGDGISYGEKHPLQGTVKWHKCIGELSQLYIVLASEGYSELISWSRAHAQSSWDASKEVDVVRIAAFFGHINVVDLFLSQDPNDCYSPESSRLTAAIIGAAEAGDVARLALYANKLVGGEWLSDAIIDDYENLLDFFAHKRGDDRREVLASSLVGSLVFSSLHDSSQRAEGCDDQISLAHKKVIQWIVDNSVASPVHIVRAAALALPLLPAQLHCFARCTDLLMHLVDDYGLNIWECQKELYEVCKAFLDYADICCNVLDSKNALGVVLGWFEFLSRSGLDIQSLNPRSSHNEASKSFAASFSVIQSTQLKIWSQFDLIKVGGSLAEIQEAVTAGRIIVTVRYKQGLFLTHLAAAYNRRDVVMWLVKETGMPLDARDGLGRTVQEVARVSNAECTYQWISRENASIKISQFGTSHFRRRRASMKKHRMLHAIIMIQAWQRALFVRRIYQSRLVSQLEKSMRFRTIWAGCIDALVECAFPKGEFTWASLKQKDHDILRSKDVLDNEMSETTRMLGEAAARTSVEVNVSDGHDDCIVSPDDTLIADDADPLDSQELNETWSSTGDVTRIKMTGDVIKWLRQGDSKYRDFFVRRIKQLAAGERSRILAKRLTGCKTLIYETYLEQKSGHRILWTECEDDSLLIWYVAKHKNVSRLISLIDDAESRSKRQLTLASSLSGVVDEESHIESENAVDERIMLDPLGDTPLKLYEVEPEEVEKLRDDTWKPRLYLTTREREIVQTTGTVLLLGRSGTGKTCVICNRMDFDRQRAEVDPSFSQLFVSRSQRLRDYVKEVVDISNADDTSSTDLRQSMKFETFGQVIRCLENTLPVLNEATNLFLPSHRMDFGRFRREVYRPEVSDELDALVIWTNIRSFIKGSIEALLSSERVLSEDDYLGLGKRRCRLSPEQRKCVYATFVRYASYMKELQLWDDCDRVTALVRRVEYARASDPIAFEEARHSKLYVDEVQDYTQAEIALFFYLCGPGDLFLAGDPAQSVVEGVEFRFEEIRSVGYHLYGEDRRHLIPDKPKTVHLNFRSHCGILDIAAAVLSCLFQVFPGSAKQLKEDQGLFQGPRPGVFHKVPSSRLQELITKRNGIVLLTHDREVPRVRQSLNDYPLVYGIREAKGLEFQEVILVDFFVGMPLSLQKLWRDLLLGRDRDEVSRRPEVEGQLKLLYTAITRCIQRMFFAETISSVAGDAFVRWLTTTSTAHVRKDSLAIKSRVDDVEKMTRTPDEWRSAGLDNAIMAESSDDLVESEKWLDRAIYCFEQVGDTALASKARMHRSSTRFRLPLLDHTAEEQRDATQIEVEAALLLENLLAEQLFFESREVCTAVLPFLEEGSQEMLQKQLLSRLPLIADNDF